MTRAEKIAALDLMIQQLKIEQRIVDWLEAHPSATVWSMQGTDHDQQRYFSCHVVANGRSVVTAKGNTEDDARAHAFSQIFLREAASA